MKKTYFDNKIAVIAGAFRLPFLVVEGLRAQGWDVFIIGIKNYCDPGLKPDIWARIGQAGMAIKQMKRRGIKQLTMAGALGNPNLSDIRPDFASIGILTRMMRNQSGHNSMLAALVAEIEKLGFKVLAPQILCPALTFEKSGIMTKSKPAKENMRDIEHGIQVSRAIGKLDIGHSVVVAKQVLAVEAAEGTAEMMNRVKTMRTNHKKKGGVLVKMIKPGQDLRVDTTAIGVDTVIAAAEAKLNGIVVDAKHCIIIDKDETVKTADKNKIFIVAK